MGEESFDVVIVGAGVSGIGMACRLRMQAPGKSFVVIERRARIGGTWDLFRYPGVRSDSDMFTYAYGFRPWQDFEVLAGGAKIRDYLDATVREYGLVPHIRHGLKVTHAEWSSARQRWTVHALTEPGGEPRRFECRWLVAGTGYYDYDAGHRPDFVGIDRFQGRIVHPQQWPQDLDCRGRRVVVIGSGATAVTLVPALAEGGASVTMLQRSPSYLFSLPGRDRVGEALARVLPRRWVLAYARQRSIRVARWLYLASRRWPDRVRRFLIGQVAKRLEPGTDLRHFTPAYQPWDQRLCIMPDADLLRSLRSGQASVVTGRIAGFEADGIRLESGETLPADIVVTATGLELQALGGMQLAVDGEPYAPSRHMLYRAVLPEDLPNFGWIIGYTNATWTLKADLATSYLCRLMTHMDANGLGAAVAIDREGCRIDDESLLDNLNSGYIRRADARLPRQGRRPPWRVTHDYFLDRPALLDEAIDDGILVFTPQREAAMPSTQSGSALQAAA